MTDTTNTTTLKTRRPVKTLIAGLIIGVAAAATVPVLAHGPRHGAPMGMMGGAGGFMGSPERIDRMVDRLLRDLNATDAQRAQVKQIAQAAAADLKAQRESTRGLHQQAMQLFAQPTVDANAVEALRQQRVAALDRSSKRVSEALIEISRVLTPEQRAQLAERMKQRSERWKERHQRHEGRDRQGRGTN